MEKDDQLQARFTLQPRRWYAAEFMGDEFGSKIRSYSPIRVTNVHPAKRGTRCFRLEFYHANYPEGVREKSYCVRTLERARHFLLVESLGHDPRRFLLIREISWEWLRVHFGIQAPSPLENLNAWLELRM